ncbi:unnamed protein product [Paramecium primaurelia]|uniref:Uncharacterized protein n=1 Tax=Paramecium primaurelia TaxID=5886 RepID=A0A8S1QFW4_PARPR|nr:unnamed protein product [Paramecium primaurelia]
MTILQIQLLKLNIYQASSEYVFQKIQPVFSQAISINDTKCWWLPKSKCKDQTAYSDANGAKLSTCTSWGSTFVSDGKNVLIKELGLSYLIPSDYVNEGTDRCCQWTGTSCILREFSDKVATSDTECLSYIFTSVLCITDQGKCVPRSTCVFYQSVADFTTGQDGILKLN